MKFGFNNIFGAATGSVIRFAPQARLTAGFFVFLICVITNADTPGGVSLSLFALTAWTFFCRPPARMILKMAAMGLAMFLPFFLLAPFLSNTADETSHSLLIPWRVFYRGIMTLMTTVVTLSTVTFSELRTGLHRLPLPNMVAHIALQIIHQTMFMYQEVVSIANALKVRGATGGLRVGIRIISMLPQVWLPRVIHRAERLAMAMEIRGYANTDFTDSDAPRCSIRDYTLIGIAVFLFLFAIVSRQVNTCTTLPF